MPAARSPEPRGIAATDADWQGRIDPELAVALSLLPAMPFDDEVAARAALDGYLAELRADPELEAAVLVDEHHVEGPPGDPPVVVRTVRPRHAGGTVPGVPWIHGGGFVVGSVAAEHAGCVQLALDVGAVVASVEYRLAPRAPVPGRRRGLLRRAVVVRRGGAAARGRPEPDRRGRGQRRRWVGGRRRPHGPRSG